MLSALCTDMHMLSCWCVRGLWQAQSGVHRRACQPSPLQTSRASICAYRLWQCNGSSRGTAALGLDLNSSMRKRAAPPAGPRTVPRAGTRRRATVARPSSSLCQSPAGTRARRGRGRSSWPRSRRMTARCRCCTRARRTAAPRPPTARPRGPASAAAGPPGPLRVARAAVLVLYARCQVREARQCAWSTFWQGLPALASFQQVLQSKIEQGNSRTSLHARQKAGPHPSTRSYFLHDSGVMRGPARAAGCHTGDRVEADRPGVRSERQRVARVQRAQARHARWPPPALQPAEGAAHVPSLRHIAVGSGTCACYLGEERRQANRSPPLQHLSATLRSLLTCAHSDRSSSAGPHPGSSQETDTYESHSMRSNSATLSRKAPHTCFL